MSMTNELAFQKKTYTPSQTNDLPQPIRIVPKPAVRRESPAPGLRRENNSILLSSRINNSQIIPAVIPRPANMSKGRERPRIGPGAGIGVSIEKVSENLHRERPISRERPTQESMIQLSNRPPLVNQSFSKDNQQRFQAPLRVRKNSELPEHKSAMIPTGCTGKLIERSRQKVAEKHASRIETSKKRDATPTQQDQLMSMIEVTKSNLYKDQQVIRHYMHKHKKTIDSLEQKHYEKSFERRKI